MKLPQTCKKIDEKLNYLYPHGCECTFVSCHNGWGLKLFKSETVRDYAYESQKEIAKADLAPQVGRIFKLEVPVKRAKYLYHTISPCRKKAIIYGYCTQQGKVVSKQTRKHKRNLETLVKNLKKIGYSFKDDGLRNVAYIKNKMVIIDCNPLSFSDWSYPKDEVKNGKNN
jgi:hypothetical protein